MSFRCAHLNIPTRACSELSPQPSRRLAGRHSSCCVRHRYRFILMRFLSSRRGRLRACSARRGRTRPVSLAMPRMRTMRGMARPRRTRACAQNRRAPQQSRRFVAALSQRLGCCTSLRSRIAPSSLPLPPSYSTRRLRASTRTVTLTARARARFCPAELEPRCLLPRRPCARQRQNASIPWATHAVGLHCRAQAVTRAPPCRACS